MKSKKPHFTEANSSKLAKAVFRHLKCADEADFLETLRHVRVHGTDMGFHGFIYHADLIAFWKKNRILIRLMIYAIADNSGKDVALLNIWSHIQSKHKIGAGIAFHALTARYDKRVEAVYEELSLLALIYVADNYLGVRPCR